MADCGNKEEEGNDPTGAAERRRGSFYGDNVPSSRWDEYGPWNDYGGAGRLPENTERTKEYFSDPPTGAREDSRTVENNRRGAAGQIPAEREETGISYRSRTLVMPGETCLLGPDAVKPTGLYGTGTCRGEQISLTNLPCVVGKMREYVDEVLDDSSVSRMHARFSIDQEGKMTVRDLNSTNGTWLNGERLRPNESRTMHQGDHVRLGRMEFVYR